MEIDWPKKPITKEIQLTTFFAEKKWRKKAARNRYTARFRVQHCSPVVLR